MVQFSEKGSQDEHGDQLAVHRRIRTGMAGSRFRFLAHLSPLTTAEMLNDFI